ncbi:MAG: hypothetical protein KF752_05130 [Pirellulaceae bacterium]|nr:hypothetical protein [Pirellulaceae bacterium]
MKELRRVRDKCSELRHGSNLVYQDTTSYSFLAEGGEKVEQRFSEKIELTTLKDQWVRTVRRNDSTSLKVRNNDFVFSMNQVGKHYALSNSSRVAAGADSIIATRFDRADIMCLNAACSITPFFLLVDALERRTDPIPSENLIAHNPQIEFEMLAEEFPFDVPSKIEVQLDAAFRVRHCHITFSRDSKSYEYLYDVEYDETDTVYPMLPKTVNYCRAQLGLPGKDTFQTKIISYSANYPVDLKIFSPEHYGIPTSALEGLHPRSFEQWRWVFSPCCRLSFSLQGFGLCANGASFESSPFVMPNSCIRLLLGAMATFLFVVANTPFCWPAFFFHNTAGGSLTRPVGTTAIDSSSI